MNSNSDNEQILKNTRKTGKKRKTQNGNSEQSAEGNAQGNFSQFRLPQTSTEVSKATDNTSIRSFNGSEKSYERAPRSSSLNREKAQGKKQQYKPFEHKELYPFPIQKYITDSQKARRFLIEEAVSNLRAPNEKLHLKDLEKMHLLALIQEKEIDNTLISATKSSLPFSHVPNQNIVTSNAMQLEVENQINFNAERGFIPSTNDFIPQNPDIIVLEEPPHHNYGFQNAHVGPTNMGFCSPNQNMQIEEDRSNGSFYNNFEGPQGYTDDYPQQQPQYSNFHGSQQNQSNQYPQADIQMMPGNMPYQQYSQQMDETHHYNQYPAHQQHQGYNSTNTFNFQENNISINSRPQQFPGNQRQQPSSNLTTFADQQLARINDFLVQQPNTFSNLTQSKTMDFLTVEDSPKFRNSMGTNDSSTGNPGNPSTVPSKGNRKAFLKMKSDPNKIEHLAQSIHQPFLCSNSVFHSKNPSSGGNNQSFSSLSQFSSMNQDISPVNSMSNIPGTITLSIPSIELKVPQNSQAFLQESNPISQALAENLPSATVSAAKKKMQAFARSKTDPSSKNLDQIANNIMASGIPFYNPRDSGSFTR